MLASLAPSHIFFLLAKTAGDHCCVQLLAAGCVLFTLYINKLVELLYRITYFALLLAVVFQLEISHRTSCLCVMLFI